jgi:hypothetical protein
MSDRSPARTRQPAESHGGLRLLAIAAVSTGVALLLAAAFVLSYSGIHAVALSAGVTPRMARIYPLILDAMLVVACAAVLSLRGAGLPSRCYAWLSMLVLLAAAAAADALHATGTRLPRRPAAAAVAVIPWVFVLIGFGLLLCLLRQARLLRRAAAEARAETSPEPSGHVTTFSVIPAASSPEHAPLGVPARPLPPVPARDPAPARPLPATSAREHPGQPPSALPQPTAPPRDQTPQPAPGQPQPTAPTDEPTGQPAAVRPQPTTPAGEHVSRPIPRQARSSTLPDEHAKLRGPAPDGELLTQHAPGQATPGPSSGHDAGQPGPSSGHDAGQPGPGQAATTADPAYDLAIDAEPDQDDPVSDEAIAVSDEASLPEQPAAGRVPRAREEAPGVYRGQYADPAAPAFSPAPTVTPGTDTRTHGTEPDAELDPAADDDSYLVPGTEGAEDEASSGPARELVPEPGPGREPGPDAEAEPEAEPGLANEAELMVEPDEPTVGPASAPPQFERMRSSPIPPGS